MAYDDTAGSSVQTKIPGRPGAAQPKTGGPIGGGVSSSAPAGGPYTNTEMDVLRSVRGGKLDSDDAARTPAGGGSYGDLQAGARNQANESPAKEKAEDKED
jgi:hypothetical protein